MKLTTEPAVDLTYCTNIHPGNGWREVLANLRQYAPALKRRLAPDAPFGLGLRLSAVESEELLHADHLRQFRGFLAENGLYVALLNGFPYGSFHRRVIKEDVFAPDWRDEKRVQYTLRLIEILKALLPEGMDGGISTSPLSYKRWVEPGDRAAWETMTRNLVRVAEALVRVRQAEGRFIHLDIEPEPDGLVENSVELVAFYQDWLLPAGAPLLAGALRVPVAEARRLLLDHLQVCLDTCHVAVEYEEPAAVLARFEQAEIQVGRLQISSALRVPLPASPAERARLARQLAPFAESSYLHQVLERRDDGALHHHPDLADALPLIQEPRAREWRIHFHVPLFVEDYGSFGSTQAEILPFFRRWGVEALGRWGVGALGRWGVQACSPGPSDPSDPNTSTPQHLSAPTPQHLNAPTPQRPNTCPPFTRHLEIETYTWEVLPPALKLELGESIHREYAWVLTTLRGCGGEPEAAGAPAGARAAGARECEPLVSAS